MTDRPTHISEVVKRLDDISEQHVPSAQAHLADARTETARALQIFANITEGDSSPDVSEIADNYTAARQKIEEAQALLARSIGGIAAMRSRVVGSESAAQHSISGGQEPALRSPGVGRQEAGRTSQAFVEGIAEAFANITDVRSRNNLGPDGTENAKLYPWAPLEGHDNVKSVVTTQDDPEVESRARIISTPTIVLSEGDFSTLYHVRDGEIWKRQTYSHGRRAGETESAAVRCMAIDVHTDMQLDAAFNRGGSGQGKSGAHVRRAD